MTERIQTASAETFRSLRSRNFRLFFTGQLISQTGKWVSMVAQTLLVLSMTSSGIALGLLTAFQFGPVLVLGAWAGAVADRADKQRLLIVMQSLAMVQSFALGAIVLLGWHSLALIYALALVQGVITSFDNPARRAFVVEMVPDDDLPNAVSLNSAVMTGARVLGPAVAGALVVTVGYGWSFVIGSVSYVGVLAGLVMMRPAELNRAAPTPKGKGQVRAGLRYVAANRRLLVPIAMMAAIGTFAYNFSVSMPLLVEGPLGGGATSFTLLFSVVSLGSLIGALSTARRKSVTGHHVVVGATGFGASLLLLSVAPNLTIAYVVGFGLGLASILFLTSSTATVQLLADAEYRGRVLALQSMVFLGSAPIGGPLVGWVADVAGPRAAVAMGGVACLAAAALGQRALRERPSSRLVDTGEVALVD
ncbi:MAG: MFS transporter [Acidimicrobiales bacterium]|nr:MFS transporter [Acidimicrobiales bacterium]